MRSGEAIHWFGGEDYELPDRRLRYLRFAPRSCVHRPYAVSSEGMDRRSRSPGSPIRAPRSPLCHHAKPPHAPHPPPPPRASPPQLPSPPHPPPPSPHPTAPHPPPPTPP